MTVVPEFLCRDTEALVLPTKSFYPTSIPIAHYQLRHYISSPEPGVIYYVSGHDVFCLNTATKQRTHITTLTFDARCTASGYGWICAGGGDGGEFAMIKLDGDVAADVDSHLRLDFAGTLPHRSKPTITVEKMSDDIVNSVSIHRLEDDHGKEEIIAVLTANDNTIRLYSLTRGEEIAVLESTFAMNHATISPDGQTLVGVGDKPKAFFYERVDLSHRSIKSACRASYSPFSEWELFQEVDLHLPHPAHVEGYFTTAWSPSGHLCAVGSECGYITVMDADILRECEDGQEAILTVINSTRPDGQYGPGAVRSMIFSPKPWDLLIWSEDHGTVCVADLRTELLSRQVIHLNPEEDGLLEINVEEIGKFLSSEISDLTPTAQFIRRYQHAYNEQNSAVMPNHTTSYLEAQADRRRMQRLAGVITTEDELAGGLTEHERQILEALRTTRQREDARSGGVPPRSISYSPSELGGSSTTRFATAGMDFPTLRETGSAQLPQVGSLRDFLRERAMRHSTLRDTPTTSSSININTPSATSSTSRSPIDTPAGSSGMPSTSDDAWHTIEQAMATSRREALRMREAAAAAADASAAHRRDPTRAETSSSSAQLPREQQRDAAAAASTTTAARRRQYTDARQRALRMAEAGRYDASFLRRAPARSIFGEASWGVRTAGLAMSRDGTVLFVGTERGIFECAINVGGRKAFPAVELR